MNIGELVMKISADSRQFESALNNADNALKKSGEKMNQIGSKMTGLVTLPLLGMAAGAVKVGMDFTSSMSEVQAISGATGKDLQMLEDIAREMGSQTKFSASQSAEGLQYMALAGWKAAEMVEALPSVLSLAAAANMDLGTASDIVTDTMSAFQMQASDSAKAADIFAYAMSNTNTDVEMLGEAMKYVGAAAHAANMDIAETSAVLGILADSGVKGSMAGTTMVSMLRDMKKNALDGKLEISELGKEYDKWTRISIYDANGAMRSMGDIMGDVEKATKDMTTEQKDATLANLFGTEAMKGVNIMLATGYDRYVELTKGMEGAAGTAEKMSDIMMDNVGGSIQALKSQLEELGLQFFDVAEEPMMALIKKLQDGAKWFGELDKESQMTFFKFAAAAAATGPLLKVAGSIAAIGTAGLATGGLLAVFAYNAVKHFDKIKEEGQNLADTWEGFHEVFNQPFGIKAIGDFLKLIYEATDAIGGLLKAVLGMTDINLDKHKLEKGWTGNAKDGQGGGSFGTSGTVKPENKATTVSSYQHYADMQKKAEQSTMGGNVIHGQRANGGAVMGGKSYLVGERGKEVFTPSTGGHISNDKGGAPVIFERGAFEGSIIMDDYGVDRLMDRISMRLKLSSATI